MLECHAPLTVLLVEDSNIIRWRVRRRIETIEGASVVGEATTASDAITAIRAQKPDVVLLDLQLESGTGFDVLQAAQGLGARPVFIVLTNYPYPPYRVRCAALGAEYFFDKSLDLDRVLDTLRGLIGAAVGKLS